jgi:hypothetical protein
MMPVDYAARITVMLTRHRLAAGRTFHLANSQPVTYPQLGAACVACGYEVTPLPYEEWRARFLAACKGDATGADSALAPLVAFFPAELGTGIARYDCSGLMSVLEQLDLPPTLLWPPAVDAELLGKYVRQQMAP